MVVPILAGACRAIGSLCCFVVRMVTVFVRVAFTIAWMPRRSNICLIAIVLGVKDLRVDRMVLLSVASWAVRLVLIGAWVIDIRISDRCVFGSLLMTLTL